MTGFPADPSKLEAGIAFGADLSVDPTTLTYTAFTTSVQPQILITRGRIGDSSVTQPSTIDATLLNPGGVFSPRNISGTHYGQLRRNTPMRVRVDPGSGMVTRGFGYIPDWQVRWDGPNIGDKIQVQPSGVMRRVGQGQDLQSAMYRTIMATNPVAYWPLEDVAGATRGASAIEGQGEAAGPGVLFGAAAGPAGSASTPDFLTHLANVTASVIGGSSTSWCVGFAMSAPYLASAVARVYTTGGTHAVWRFFPPTGVGAAPFVVVEALDGTPATTLAASGEPATYPNVWHHWAASAQQSGGNVISRFFIDGVQVATSTDAGTVAPVTRILLNQNAAAVNSMAHVEVTNATTPAGGAAINGYPGELAAVRFARLCVEGGITSDVAAGESEAMGPQLPGTLLGLLRECESSDEATMLERTNGKLGFDPTSFRYNQSAVMTVDYSLLADLLPNDDDRDMHNDVTASRVNGSSGRSELALGPLSVNPVTGVGDYPDSQTRSLYLDSQAASHASWLVNLGTVDEPRFVIGLNLRAHPEMVTQWLACDISDRIVVNNAPAMHLGPAPLDLIIEGYTELLDAVEWFVTIYCLPYRPYEVYQVQTGTGNRSRIPMPDATCTNDVQRSATDTSIAVTSTQVRWIDSGTYASQFPFQVLIAGEVMTVTAIAGTTLSQTLTVTRGFHGVSKILPAGSTVQLWRPPVTAL